VTVRVARLLARIGSAPAAVLAPLVVATAAIALATFGADRAVRSLADGALAGAARSISLAAERGLGPRMPGMGGPPVDFARLFSERVVAFALVADRDGRVLVHTNPELVGTRVEPPGRGGAADPFGGSGRRETLGTGIQVWVEDRPLRLRGGPAGVLRVAIYTEPVDGVLARFGVLRWGVLAAVAGLWGAGGTVVLLARRAHRLEREAARREELALVGQMTATLAHEIRNAIAGVKGHAQLAAERTGGDDPRGRQLELVLRGAARIEDLAEGLLGFAREERVDIAAVDLRRAVEAAVAAVSWGGTVAVGALPEAAVSADPGKLERALLDGIRNAVEAMGERGTLRISGERRGREAVLRLEDDGPGVAPEALERAFTPFFTTKSSGTGLGLATARKALAAMGGAITLGNRPGGAGAVLTITLPLAKGA